MLLEYAFFVWVRQKVPGCAKLACATLVCLAGLSDAESACCSTDDVVARRAERIGREAMTETCVPRGPRANPDDQIRAFWLLKPHCYTNFVKMGFNTFILQHEGLQMPAAACEARMRESRQWWMDRTAEDGLDYIEQIYVQQHPWFRENCVRRRADGSTAGRKVIDASDPEQRGKLLAAARSVLETIPTNPPASFVGLQPASEVRDGTFPSGCPAFREAWRRFSGGREIPDGCQDALGPNWHYLADIPASRIVPDDYPILSFYRWFWKEGDGWNGYLDEVMDMARRRFGRPLLTMYDPAVRTPPLRGSGASASHLNHWVYPYPEPYNVSYIASEEMAMARGNPGKEVMMMVQGISYRSTLAPKGEDVEDKPDWLSETPNVTYMTTPPDMMREALWTLLTRRLSGLLVYSCRSFYDCSTPEHPRTAPGYQCTHPGLPDAVGDVMNRVAVPLGPLLKAFPERPMEVAVLESFASAILAQACDYGWHARGRIVDAGTVATAANLMPHTLYEEDLAAAGVPESVKVLLLPRCEVLAESAARAIRKFQDRGGVVVGDDLLAPGIVADFDMRTFRRGTDAATDRRDVRGAAAALRRSLAPYYLPAADSDTMDILASVRSYGRTDLLFAVNDRRVAGDYVGQWGHVFEKGVPVRGTVALRRVAGAVYDLVRHCAVDFDVVDGVTRISVDLAAADGAVFLVADAPLGILTAEMCGDELCVMSPDCHGMIPVGVFAEGERPRYGVVRDGVYRCPVKPTAGTVRVMNLADGRETVAATVARPRFAKAQPPSSKPSAMAEKPACRGLPPSQDPTVDHEVRVVHEIKSPWDRFFMPKKIACDAVEIRLGRESEPLRARVNGVLAAVYDPSRDGDRDFRFDATALLQWGVVNDVKFEDARGQAVERCYSVAFVAIEN